MRCEITNDITILTDLPNQLGKLHLQKEFCLFPQAKLRAAAKERARARAEAQRKARAEAKEAWMMKIEILLVSSSKGVVSSLEMMLI